MRIATLIISLLIGLLLFIQSFGILALSDAESATYGAGAVGLIMAFMWLLGAGLVLAFPMASGILFGLSAVLGLLVPTGAFGDLRFHGGVAVVLMVMAALGYRDKQKQDREKQDERIKQEERDALMARMVQSQERIAYGRMCRACGMTNDPNVKFCGECGAQMPATVVRTAEETA